MADHLVFTLAAALGATGEFAGHERRGSVGWPGRSAILGLVAAALGVRRHEVERLAEMENLKVAVAVFDEGEPLRDYHTVMTIPTAKAKRPNSRREAFEMARGDINTTITKRDYRASPLFGVAVWGADLVPVQAALKKPGLMLYLGRKCCPLAAPMNPLLVAAASPVEALKSLSLPPWYQAGVATRVYADSFEGAGANVTEEQRHDIAIDRKKWHFAPRKVLRISTSISAKSMEVQ
jgi:CRISPR system Cascade subunit CasD